MINGIMLLLLAKPVRWSNNMESIVLF